VAPSAEATALTFDRVVAELAASRHASEANTQELRKFNSRLTTKPVSAVSRLPSPSPQRSPAAPRRVTFAAEPRRGQGNQPSWRGRGRASTYQRQPRTSSVDQSTTTTNCGYCGGNHAIGRQYCRASEVMCHNSRNTFCASLLRGQATRVFVCGATKFFSLGGRASRRFRMENFM